MIRKPKLFIQIGDDTEFEISERVRGAHFLTLKVGAPQSLTNYRTQIGVDGSQQLGDFTYGPLPISADFYLEATDHYDYRLACGDLYDVLFNRKLIRIRDDLEPGKCAYVYAKPFEQTKLNYAESTFTVEFEAPSGFRQSVINSDQLAGFSESLQFGQGLQLLDDPPSYQFNKDYFLVYNYGSIPIEPLKKQHTLNILMNLTGTPVLRNTMNDSKVTFSQKVVTNDTVLLKGPKAFINGKPVGSKVTGNLWLSTGMNTIEVTGCTSIDSIIFSFPFLYH
ncbi:phage tail domain-containing protein [Lactiplantibacillus paraxiangfangensis]|uniref:phage tail domain-containing protein n=1 Tax=Lactiplantibacillus paraxiangfangensis TaxID=3076224 RepID=UPI0030C6B9C7